MEVSPDVFRSVFFFANAALVGPMITETAINAPRFAMPRDIPIESVLQLAIPNAKIAKIMTVIKSKMQTALACLGLELLVHRGRLNTTTSERQLQTAWRACCCLTLQG
jgi:hypothetical protein